MKKISIILLLLATVFTFNACEDIQDIATENAVTGGLVEVLTPLYNFIPDNGDDQSFGASIKVFQGDVKTQTIEVYNKYVTSDEDGNEVVSNERLVKSFDISENATSILDFTVTPPELREGLTLNGASLDDVVPDIGDYWELSYRSKTSEGKDHLNVGTTKIAVSSRFAGLYNIVQGWYIHPSTAPGLAADYSGEYLRVIESVTITTYRMTAIGPWPNDPNVFYFEINDDYTITIPKEYNGDLQTVWDGDELATCPANASNLPDVSCVNTAELVDNGEDIISISYGYIRDTGTRQFDDILVKNP